MIYDLYIILADGEALSEEDGSGDEEAPLEDSSGIKPTQKRKRTKKKAVDDSRCLKIYNLLPFIKLSYWYIVFLGND